MIWQSLSVPAEVLEFNFQVANVSLLHIINEIIAINDEKFAVSYQSQTSESHENNIVYLPRLTNFFGHKLNTA